MYQNNILPVFPDRRRKGPNMKQRSPFTKICVILAAILLLTSCTAFLAYGADNTTYTDNIYTMVVSSTDGSCNLRSGPGLSYGVITPIYNGTSLRVTALYRNSGDALVWGQTTYNGYTGWISVMTTYVSTSETSSKASYDVTVSNQQNIVLRAGPGTEYNELYKPYDGQVLRIDETIANSFDGRPWGKTTVNGVTGWVSLNWTYRNASWTYNKTQDITYYNNTYNARVASDDGYVNFRTGPGLAYGVIQPIYNGNYLRITAALDNSTDGLVWGQTTYNGVTGWICMEPTVIESMATASTAQYNVKVNISENLKLRTGPGSEYPLLADSIPNGTSLYITQTMINSFDGRPWGRTTYNGVSGWISLNWTTRY